MQPIGVLGILLSVLLASCSADAVDQPEPSVETPGAFVAVTGEDGLILFRTLDALIDKRSNLLFITVYSVRPANWADAREISKRSEIPIAQLSTLMAQNSLPTPLQVVWYRSLTLEELERIP